MAGGVVSKNLVPTLPRDIIRLILLFLPRNKQLLLNCALVSHDWLLESRPLLLRNIRIPGEHSGDRFVSMVLHSDRLAPWLRSIHHLSFCFGNNNSPEKFFSDISERLPNLRTMKWVDFFPTTRHQPPDLCPEVFLAFGKFTRLYHLELNDCSFATFQDLKQTIVAFPSLRSLRLFEVSWRSSSFESCELSLESPSTHTWPATLSQLSLDSHCDFLSSSDRHIDDILLWLSAMPTQQLLNLKEFSFNIWNITAALQLIAHTSLTFLDVRTVHNTNNIPENYDIERLRPLISQVGPIELLNLPVIYHDDAWYMTLRMLQLFGPCPSIHRVRFSCESEYVLLHDSDPPQFDYVSAKKLVRALLGSPEDPEYQAFRALHTVEFVVCLPQDDSETLQRRYALFSSWPERTFPRLRERYAVEMYVHNTEFVCGPAGLSELGDDFPFVWLKADSPSLPSSSTL